MEVHQINPNSVKFKIPSGMVTVTGPYANGLRTLKKGSHVGMALFIEEKVPPKEDKLLIKGVEPAAATQSSDDDSSSLPEASSGGAKPLNGE